MRYVVLALFFMVALFAGINIGIGICARHCVMFTGPMADLVYTEDENEQHR